MSLISVAGVLLVSVALVGVLGAVYQRSPAATPWVPRVLRVAALLLTLLIAIGFSGVVWQDSAWFGLLLVGVPVVCSLVAVIADLTGVRTALLTTLAAAVLLLWSLVTIVGLGLYFLGPAIVLAAAAATSWQRERRTRGGATSNRSAASSSI